MSGSLSLGAVPGAESLRVRWPGAGYCALGVDAGSEKAAVRRFRREPQRMWCVVFAISHQGYLYKLRAVVVAVAREIFLSFAFCIFMKPKR